MDNQNDLPQLIARACQGDEEACAALIEAHQTGVFRFAYLLLGDADEAADVAQEAFIRALAALEGFDPSRPLRPWLLSITANLARNRHRAWGRYWGAVRRWWGMMGEGSSDAEQELVQHWEAQALWEAVQQLPTLDQEIIYLRYFMELSISETAEILSIETGTVKSRLNRALGRLRKVVEQGFPLLMEGRKL